MCKQEICTSFSFVIFALCLMFSSCQGSEVSDNFSSGKIREASEEGRPTTKAEEQPLRIALLAYGSLIQEPVNRTNGVVLATEGEWKESTISLPISLLRLSSKGLSHERATRVVDNTFGTPLKAWYVPMKSRLLDEAMQNLAGREGAPVRDAKYRVDNIFYIRKLSDSDEPGADEIRIAETEWVIRSVAEIRRRISEVMAQEIVAWAQSLNFFAVIWASFPPNTTFDELRITMTAKPETLKRTKDYINNLPVAMKRTPFELEILNK